MKNILFSVTLAIILCFFNYAHANTFYNPSNFPQNSITWNSVTASAVSVACANGEAISISFSVVSADVLQIEANLADGMQYIDNSAVLVSGGTLNSVNSSDKNQPVFEINASAGANVVLTFDRKATCDSRTGQINGNTFEDEIRVLKAGTQIGTSQKSNAYQINYAALSITSQSTTPATVNVGGTVTRSVTIANGSFGALNTFTFKDVRPAATLAIQSINVIDGGNTYPVNAANITNTATELEIIIDATMLSNIGNANGQLDLNESITIVYTVKVLDCYQGAGTSSALSASWGCEGAICETATANAAVNISNGVPNMAFTNISKPNVDFCQAVTYSSKLTNNSTDPKDFARDVAIICGLRANSTPVATPTANTLWSGQWRGTRNFTNFKLNGIPITLPTLNKNGPVDYVAYDYFTTDPDGVGVGLDDIDGDGYYDDLAPGAEVTISFEVYLTPRDVVCSNGSYANYLFWEHIAADASWHNQCGVQMQPVRDAYNYVNFIRNYLTPTPVSATPNIEDGVPFTVGIKPHIAAYAACNGQSAVNGAGVDFQVAVVLPTGVSLSPTAAPDAHTLPYNPNIYQSNDTVYYTINRYLHNWFNFELVMDCNAWPGLTEYATFNFITTYTCSDGVNICFKKDIHCETVAALPQCSGNCSGPTTKYFNTKRINPGWADADKTTLATNYNTSYGEVLDTVRFEALAVMNDTAVDNLTFTTSYGTIGNNLFNYHTGKVIIYDIDNEFGQTTYTFPLTTPPTVTDLGNNEYQVDLDLSPFQNMIHSTYLFGKGNGSPNDYDADSIKLILDFVIEPGAPNRDLNTLTDFLGYFSFTDNSTQKICNKYASTFSYGRAYLNVGGGTSNVSGSGARIAKYYVNATSVRGVYTTEYRPYYHFDSIAFQSVTGIYFDKVHFFGGWGGSFGVTTFNNPPYVRYPSGRFTLPRPATYRDPHNGGEFYPRVQLDVLFDCRLPAGTTTIPSTLYAKEYAYLSDVNSQLVVAKTSTQNIIYTPPDFTINTGQQKKSILDNTVDWEIEICNTSAGVTIPYNWLLIDDKGGNIIITGATDISGAPTPLNIVNNGNGKILVELGDLDAPNCKKIRIEATYTECNPDEIGVKHGWSGREYPIASDLYACGTEYLFEVERQNSQLSMAVTPLANTPNDPSNGSSAAFSQSTIDMCSPFPVEITMTSAQLGYLYDVIAEMKNPISGGGSALEFVSGSGYIEYPIGTTPRPFSALSNTNLVAASSNTVMPFDLSVIDPMNFNNLPFKGVGTPDSNTVVLRFKLQSNCLLNSGDVFSFESAAKTPCASDALGSGELISAYNLNVTGVTTPYAVNFTAVDMPDIYGCSQNAVVSVALTKVGSVSVGADDKLVVVLPPDVNYNALISCTTPVCVDPNQLVISTVGSSQVLNFKMPAMNNGDDLAFTLSVSYSTTSHGCSENLEQLRAQVVTSSTVFCAATGSNCPDFGATVGQLGETVNFYKPEIELSNVVLTDSSFGASPQLYHFDFDIQNTGIQNTLSPLLIDFYCANNLGQPTGSLVHSIAMTSNLNAGQTVNFSGNFTNNCNADNGIIIQVTRQNSNNASQCLCEDEILNIIRRPVSSISGEIFFDMNNNTINDSENAGALANGIIVRLQDLTGNPIQNANNTPITYTVSSNGLYSFTDLLPNSYKVVLDQTTTPTNYEGGNPNTKLVGLGLGQDIGQQDLAIQTCQLTIADVVTSSFPDCSNTTNGEIIISANSNSPVQYSITNEPNYQVNNIFSNLGQGLYTIRAVNEAGCSTIHNVPILLDFPTCIENCNNGIDDDGDGLVDCDDDDCGQVPNVNIQQNN